MGMKSKIIQFRKISSERSTSLDKYEEQFDDFGAAAVNNIDGLKAVATALGELAAGAIELVASNLFQLVEDIDTETIEGFAESANIDHRRIFAEPLQSRYWLSGKAEFAVIIIFNYPASCFGCHCQ